MSADTTNALLNFSGGLLAFAAVVCTIIRPIFAKERSPEEKERLTTRILALIELLLISGSVVFRFWLQPQILSLVFLSLYLLIALFAFCRSGRGRSCDRQEIVLEAILPTIIFLLFFMLSLNAETAGKIKKTEPNQALQTTTMAVTDAAQPPRQP